MNKLPPYWTSPDTVDAESEIAKAIPPSPDPDDDGDSRNWKLVLRESPFFTGGGGQLPDKGRIDGCAILSIAKDGDSPLFVVDADADADAPDRFRPGRRVQCLIDPEHRRDSRQQHSGQHLISAALSRAGIETLSVHLGTGYCGIETDMAKFDPDAIRHAEAQCESWIRENLPINSLCLSPEELEALNLRRPIKASKASEAGVIRVVEIEGVDAVGCGGVHLRETGSIRAVIFDGCEKLRGRLRLKWLVGDRAIRRAGDAYRAQGGLLSTLSVKEEELLPRVTDLLAENNRLAAALRQADRELGASTIRAAPSSPAPAVFRITGSKDRLEGALDAIRTSTLSAAFLLSDPAPEGRCAWALYLADAAGNRPPLIAYLAASFDAKGGGKAPVWRGVMRNLSEAELEEIKARLAAGEDTPPGG